MTEQVAYEHGADLRRDAATFRCHTRVASRADRREPSFASRLSAVLHRRPAVAGCAA
jgi:hypothetical protein